MKHVRELQFVSAPPVLLCTCMLVAGCASAPPATQTIQVPVYVPCVAERPQRPAYEFDKLQAAASDGRKVMALAKDWLRGRKYEGELEAIIAACH